MKNETYFPTLGAALESFTLRLSRENTMFADGVDLGMAFNGGVPYGQTVSRSFELATYKGRKTRKYAHAVLYRMESGTYELTAYCL